MEIATNNQSILTTHLQPLVTGMMPYPGRCGVWHPVATNTAGSIPVSAMTELPKESIIANTDFTTTSVIAKRRLSSKKRRMQHQNGSTGSDISTESSTQSPMSSADGSPAMGSTTFTPDKNDADPYSHKAASNGVAAGVADLSHSSLLPSSTSSNGIPLGGSGHYISMASNTHPVGLMHNNQIANPMLSHLQQGLNYRFLQGQPFLQQQQQQQQAVGISTQSSSHVEHPRPLLDETPRVASQHMHSRSVHTDTGSGFKWCVAHVMIAKQIQHHRQHQNEGSTFHVYPKPSSSFQSPPNHPAPPQNHTPPCHAPPPFSTTSQQQHQQQQQQQSLHQHQQHPTCPPHSTVITSAPSMSHLALMQYSHSAAAAATFPPGYLALPYSSLQDVQLRMHQAPPMVPVQLGGGFPLMKPVMTMSDSVIGLNPPVVGGVPLQQAQLTMAHSNPHAVATATAVMRGPAGVGSWVAPIPVMNSCVINNPCQPGVIPAPWVK